VQKPDALERYISEVTEAIVENDYDGVDLDWEHPETTEAIRGYTSILEGLRKALDELGEQQGRQYLLTVAVNGWRFGVPGEVFAANADLVNVMTYDMAGPWSHYLGHHARLKAAETDEQHGEGLSIITAMEFWSQTMGIPRGRLLVGLPFYARGFEQMEPFSVVEEKNEELHKTYLYNELAALEEQGWTRQWNDTNQTPWLISPTGDAAIGYDDAQSIGAKVRWAQDHGHGVMIWAIGQDRLADGSYPLMQAVTDSMGTE